MSLFHWIISALIVYFLFANTVTLVLLLLSFIQIRKLIRSGPMLDSMRRYGFQFVPPVSLIAPAYNEEKSIVHAVQSFLTLDYPRHDVWIVNDGSTDRTLEALVESFKLEPVDLFFDDRLTPTPAKLVYQSQIHRNLFVIDKPNSGKADSINIGIGYSRYDHFASVDSDSILEPDALLRVIIPFIMESEKTVASGGSIRPVNSSDVRYGRVTHARLPLKLLPLIQVVEYLRAFLFGRVGWSSIDSMLIISGAFGVFQKEAVIQAGGYQSSTVGEDMELVLRLRQHFAEKAEDYRVAFVPDPICWTEVPESLNVLSRQRDRWQRGLAESLLAHRKILFNPRYGMAGMLGYPYFVIVEFMGPLIEMLSYGLMIVGMLFSLLDPELLVMLLVADILYGILLSFIAVLIDESAFHRYPKIFDLTRLFAASILEHLGYRQLCNLFRLKGMLKLFSGTKSWGEMKRAGF